MSSPHGEHDEVAQQLTEFFTAIGDDDLLDKEQKPDVSTIMYLPVVSSAEAFITKCKGHEQEELLVQMTGLTKSAAQIRNLKDSDLDEDDIDMYRRQVKRHNDKQGKLQDIRANVEARRAIDQIAADENELDDILEKLKTRFGDKQDTEKAEVLLQHCFLMFKNGATAEEFTEIVSASHEQVVRLYGEEIKVEDLTSVLFEANLRNIAEFPTVCSQMAALSDEASFEDKKKLFVSSLKHQGKIEVDAEAMQKAMFAMLKRALKDDIKVAGTGNRTRTRGYRQSKLGGAGRDEGLNAFFAQGDQGQGAQGDQKGKGKGKNGYSPRGPPGSCSNCWKMGHYARDCRSEPHPDSDRALVAQHKGKGQLWAGRAAEKLFHSNQNPFTQDDRRFMFETRDNDLDNFSEMMYGNDPCSYQLGPDKPGHSNEPAIFDEQDFESDDEDMDPAEPDSDSDSEETESDKPTLVCTGKTPKSGDITARVLAMEGKTQTRALNSSFKTNGAYFEDYQN